MSYTRRNFLRDSALISLTGGAASSSAAAYLADEQKHVTPACGVRIFFEGSWLFCNAEPDAPGMLAIARDMSTVPHIFPFGRWQKTCLGFDKSMPRLQPNPRNPMGVPYPYLITLPDFKPVKSNQTVDSIFSDAQSSAPFQYLANDDSNSPLRLDTTLPGVILISLPIPDRIRLAAFLTEAIITDNGKYLHSSQTKDYTNQGLATTHIFEYDNAKLLNFNAGSVSDSMYDNKLLLDYHFHTVPKAAMPCMDHGADMFNNLLSLHRKKDGSYLGNSEVCVTNYYPFDIKPGIDPKLLIDPSELDYDLSANNYCKSHPAKAAMNLSTTEDVYKVHPSYNLASCSGPGFGTGGQVLGN